MTETNAIASGGGERILRESGARATLIRDMPGGERPRERLRDAGPGALSDAELLAILLRTGTKAESVVALATRLLAQAGGLERLARVSHGELCGFHGFGEAKAAQLLAALELGKRIAASPGEEAKPVIATSYDAARIVKPEMEFEPQEQLRVLCLNVRNQVISSRVVFVGSVDAVNVRPVEIFREAVQMNAVGIVMAHNHPSGDPTPSEADILITREVIEAGRALSIRLMDHVIVARGGYVSLKDRGVIT